MSARGAALDGRERLPGALRKSEHGDARRIDEGLLRQEIQRAVGVAGEIDRRAAAAGLRQPARSKTVHGERHIAPGSDPLSPALIQPLPVSIATMQQHDGGRGARAAGLPQIALQRLGTRERILEFDDGRGRLSLDDKASSRASGQKRGDEAAALATFVTDHRSRTHSAARWTALYIPKIFRALAFNTFGRISSRMSSLAKSASHRSGVITGQSEPNSILSCRIELM